MSVCLCQPVCVRCVTGIRYSWMTNWFQQQQKNAWNRETTKPEQFYVPGYRVWQGEGLLQHTDELLWWRQLSGLWWASPKSDKWRKRCGKKWPEYPKPHFNNSLYLTGSHHKAVSNISNEAVNMDPKISTRSQRRKNKDVRIKLELKEISLIVSNVVQA